MSYKQHLQSTIWHRFSTSSNTQEYKDILSRVPCGTVHRATPKWNMSHIPKGTPWDVQKDESYDGSAKIWHLGITSKSKSWSHYLVTGNMRNIKKKVKWHHEEQLANCKTWDHQTLTPGSWWPKTQGGLGETADHLGANRE